MRIIDHKGEREFAIYAIRGCLAFHVLVGVGVYEGPLRRMSESPPVHLRSCYSGEEFSRHLLQIYLDRPQRFSGVPKDREGVQI